ncbi:MAG: copper chaperone PCu(A)C [Pseudomonadota bacterium]
MTSRLITRLCIGLILISTATSVPAELLFEDARIRQPPPGVGVTAGYVVIRNTGSTPIELTGAHSSRFARVEMHQTKLEDGVYRMLPQSSLTVPAQGQISLEPASYHLMLMQLSGDIAPDDRIQIVFTSKDREIPVDFTVFAP